MPACVRNTNVYWDLVKHPIGIRVSLYNAVTEEDVDKLCLYVKEFIEKESADSVISKKAVAEEKN